MHASVTTENAVADSWLGNEAGFDSKMASKHGFSCHFFRRVLAPNKTGPIDFDLIATESALKSPIFPMRPIRP